MCMFYEEIICKRACCGQVFQLCAGYAGNTPYPPYVGNRWSFLLSLFSMLQLFLNVARPVLACPDLGPACQTAYLATRSASSASGGGRDHEVVTSSYCVPPCPWAMDTLDIVWRTLCLQVYWGVSAPTGIDQPSSDTGELIGISLELTGFFQQHLYSDIWRGRVQDLWLKIEG